MAGLPNPYLAAATALPQGILGIMELSKANKGLAALSKQPTPGYSEDSRLTNAYNRAEAMTNYGFTADENAGFNQDLAMQNSAQFKNAIDIGGGNLGSTINASLNNNNIQAINQRAGQGAQLKRNNIQYADSLAQSLQSQQNLINQQKISRRNILEEQYGAAKKAGLENITNALSGGLATATSLSGNPAQAISQPPVQPNFNDYR